MPRSQTPYQRLQRNGNILLAARGSSIDSFSLTDGSYLSTWSTAPEVQAIPASSSPPTKRRKLSKEEVIEIEDPQKADEEKTNGGSESKKDNKKLNSRADAAATGFQNPAIICLAVTSDGKHVVAVTAEDKSVRVFENVIGNSGNQELNQINLRQMPKRPCAITLNPESNTIISADKFGDVYSLPLIPPERSSVPPVSGTPEPSKPYGPAANELTIHSQRNRKALENQRRQQPKRPNADRPALEGELLLGHVSMLIDLILGNVGGREYILTADRDEHIRISRGGEQSHVIEGFCLGHGDYVTRLCIPKSRAELLISGGGEDELFVWEWLNGRLLEKVNLKNHVVSLLKELPSFDNSKREEVEGVSIVVSGIFHTQVPNSSHDGVQDDILVTVEGIPAIFVFNLDASNALIHAQTLALAGNALDLVSDIPFPPGKQPLSRLLVSVDTFHKAGSTTEQRDAEENVISPFEVIEFRNGEAFRVEDLVFERVEGSEKVEEGKLSSLLYALESLRKREGEDKEE